MDEKAWTLTLYAADTEVAEVQMTTNWLIGCVMVLGLCAAVLIGAVIVGVASICCGL